MLRGGMAMVVGRCYMPSPQRSSQPMVRASTRRLGGRDARPPPLLPCRVRQAARCSSGVGETSVFSTEGKLEVLCCQDQ